MCSALLVACVLLCSLMPVAHGTLRKSRLGSRLLGQREFRAAELVAEAPAASSSAKTLGSRVRASACPNGILFGAVTVSQDAKGKSHYAYQASCDRVCISRAYAVSRVPLLT